MAKKCILFVRVSTEQQSFDEQEKELYEMAIKDGYEKENIIPIAYKESAIKLSEEERMGLNEMKFRIDTDPDIDSCYVWEISRISRTKSVLFHVEEYLIKHHIQLIIKNPYHKLLKDDGSIDEGAEMVFVLYGQLAEAEMRNRKERFKRGKKDNAKNDKYNGGYIPYGYYIKDDKTFGIKEEEKKVILDVFEWYESGKYSITQIVRKLQEKHIDEKRHFTLSFVQNILTNKLLTGELQEDRDITCVVKGTERKWHQYPRKYPQIIPIEQYLRCREIASKNKTNADKTKNIYYGNKIFRCPECGRYAVGVSNRAIYRCYDAYNTNRLLEGYLEETRCKNRKNYSINIIDTILWHCASYWEVMKSIINKKETKEKYLDKIQEIEHQKRIAQKRIEDYEKQIERIINLHIKGHLDEKKYEQKYRLVQNEIDGSNIKIRTYEKDIRRYHSLIEAMEIDDIYKTEIKGQGINFFINTKEWKSFMKNIEAITDEEKRYDIVHNNVKSLDVQEKEIDHIFDIGMRRIKMRIYTVSSFDERKLYFYVISNNGRGAAIYVKAHPIHTSSHFQLPTEPDIPVIQRYDNIKRTKDREKKKAAKQEQKAQRREGKFTIRELMAISGFGYAKIHYAIVHNHLKAEKDANEFVITKEDWENFYMPHDV